MSGTKASLIMDDKGLVRIAVYIRSIPTALPADGETSRTYIAELGGYEKKANASEVERVFDALPTEEVL